jgi:DNA-binding transcriptional LysR family regulator
VTPTQLRAFAVVVRFGSVKNAAAELGVSEAAVSLHMGQLRKELGDPLFTRVASELVFTPGGLRLAGRAAELLELQERTTLEVRHAGSGHQLLRIAASGLFAEHSAPGLIEVFAGRARNLDVELNVCSPSRLGELLKTRAVDIAIGPLPTHLDPAIVGKPFLNYQVIAVANPDHPVTRIQANANQLRQQTWLLGPTATLPVGLVPTILHRIGVPDDHRQIFPSQAAALAEARRNKGIALAVAFAVSEDLANGDLKRVTGQSLQADGVWHTLVLAEGAVPPVAMELARFMTTPRAIQAMLRGAGVAVGRFEPASTVTLWN